MAPAAPRIPRDIRGLRIAARSRTVFVVLAVVAIAGVALFAAQVRHDSLDRSDVIARARTWTDIGVPYNQTAHRHGYRTDCSGFVSMAWDLPENVTTWRIPLIATEIPKEDLEPGDVLLDYTSHNKHVVIFEKWANEKHSAYWALECSGNAKIRGAIRRVVAYPYVINQSYYRPYRYVGMDGYWKHVPEPDRQPVSD